MPVNSTQPIFLAAEIFYETMLEMGFAEEDAQLAKIAFYAIKGQVKEEVVEEEKK